MRRSSHASGTLRGKRKTSIGPSASHVSGRSKAFESRKSCGNRPCSNIRDGRIRRIVARTYSLTSGSLSSCAVPVEPAAIELLADLSKVLANWGRWYVFGAQAVTAYGVPRLSADVDVTIWLVPQEPERFASDMKAAGFALRVEDPDFVRRTSVMPFVHLATAMPVDVVLAASGLEDEFLNRAKEMDFGGTRVPIIDMEDLVIAKVLAGRPKDLEDARNLWRIHGQELDTERIRRTLRLLEEALSQNDLVPTFESIQQS